MNTSLSVRSTLAALALAALAHAACAQTLDKISASGTITLGVRDSSVPLSYMPDRTQPAGFHVELCQRVVADIRQQLRLPRLDIRYQLVNSQNRIPLVRNGTVDLECGSTTNNAARQQEVAFALTTYVEEVRMAVRSTSPIRSVGDLAGKTVVATTGTTSVQHLRRHVRASGLDIKDLLAKDHAESFLLLEQGRVDAWVLDAGLMRATIATSRNPADFAIVGEVLNTEPIALMLRRDDPAFKQAVDNTVRTMLQNGEMKALWDKWFQGPIPPRGTRIQLAPPAALLQLWAQPNDLPMESFAAR